MESSDCDKEDAIEIGVIGTVSMDLEIRKFDAFRLTSGCMSPSIDVVVFSDVSPPSCLAHSNKPPCCVSPERE